jgi:hypothetical protein
VSSAEEKEDMNRQRLNICRKKQWHKFKVQGVKSKRRASLGLTKGVGSSTPITKHGEAMRNFEFIGEDKDRQLESLWKETNIGDVFPWEDITDEAERLLGRPKCRERRT